MAAINCWEYFACGREPSGSRSEELGVCPAAVHRQSDGVNGGRMAGRYCWRVAGTLCGGEPQGSFAQKAEGCGRCAFFHLVLREAGDGIVF